MKNTLIAFILCFLTFFSSVGDSFAGGFSSSRSSGGFRSSSSFSSSRSSSSGFSSSRSSGTSVKPSSSGWGSSKIFSSGNSTPKPSTPAPSIGWGSSSSSKTKAPTPSVSSSSTPKTAFDKAKAINSIVPVKPKETFVSEFKKNNSSKYPTTFSSPPSSRPSYIPPVTTHAGKERKIEYNPQTRSYGFFDDLGKFMIYDAITDLAFDAFKKDEKRYVTEVQHVEKQANQQIKEQENENSFVESLFIGIVILGAIILIIGFIAKACE